MPPLPITVLVVHDRPEPILAVIRARCPEATVEACTRYGAVAEAIARLRPQVVLPYKFASDRPFPRTEILEAPSVEWVQGSGAGIDHLTPWDPGRVTVTNASGIHGDVMSQYAIWAILNAAHDYPGFVRNQAKAAWEKRGLPTVRGRTLAIVGYGRIGAEIARRAKAFDLAVIGVRSHPAPSPHADEVVGPERLHDALGRADFVVVVLPLTVRTRGVIGAEAFAAMKPGAYLINTGRGGIVDETALLEALRSERLSGAALDVFATEPLPADSPFWDLPNVVVTPHVSGDADDWQMLVVELFCDNLVRRFRGESLFNIVDPARGY